jgi:hypothetical protein
MAKYKCGNEAMVGDVVRCEDDKGIHFLTAGKTYCVCVIADGTHLRIDGLDYYPDRFTLVRRAAPPAAERPSDRDAARYELTIDGKPIRLESIIAACLSQERTGLTHADAGFLAHCWKYLFRMGLKSHAIHDARKLHDWTGKLVKLMETEHGNSVWVDTTGHE